MLSFGIGSAARNSASRPCTSYMPLMLLVSKHWPSSTADSNCPSMFQHRGIFSVFDLGGLWSRTRKFRSPDLGFRDQLRGRHQAIRRYNAWATAHHFRLPWWVDAKSAFTATQKPAFTLPRLVVLSRARRTRYGEKRNVHVHACMHLRILVWMVWSLHTTYSIHVGTYITGA